MSIWQTFTTSNKGPRCGHTRPGCRHTHKDGTHCKAHAQKDNQYCFFHDPAQEARRWQASSAGGRASTRPLLLPPDLPILSLKTASDVAQLLEETVNQARRGQIDLRAATTICYLGNSLVHALEVNARAEREAAKATAAPAPSKKHPAPLKVILRDYRGRIIDQLPPDPDFVPQNEQKKDLSPQMDADQRGLAQDPSAPLLATGNRELGTDLSNTPSPTSTVEQGMRTAPPTERSRGELSGHGFSRAEKNPTSITSALPKACAQQSGARGSAEPIDKPPTASSNTPSPTPSAEQGMNPARRDADSDNALPQHGNSQDLRGSSTRACALSQNDTQKNPSGKPDPLAPLLRTENRELRTTSPLVTPPPQKAQPIQYPPGMGPRHLGPGPGGSLMAGTPSIPRWRRERINPYYITGIARQTAEIQAEAARSRGPRR